ncbi:MAG: 5-carboxymethyl-2-hydroxymuconate Delta-isomerase [Bacillus sp. (in: firmicutes)]
MPHLIIEYTDNISDDIDVKSLLKKANEVLISFPDVFPIGGIRSRAIKLEDYYVADGTEDDSFIHVTLKIGAGRSGTEKKAACEKLFNTFEDHLNKLFNERYLALSLELYEFSEAGTYKKNNIHQRYKR